jgi:hypothetical protein
MKPKSETSLLGVQELCRKLKIQLDELAVEVDTTLTDEDKVRRKKLMEQLKEQLSELSR